MRAAALVLALALTGCANYSQLTPFPKWAQAMTGQNTQEWGDVTNDAPVIVQITPAQQAAHEAIMHPTIVLDGERVTYQEAAMRFCADLMRDVRANIGRAPLCQPMNDTGVSMSTMLTDDPADSSRRSAYGKLDFTWDAVNQSYGYNRQQLDAVIKAIEIGGRGLTAEQARALKGQQ